MKLIALILAAGLLLSGCSALQKDYQAYDRSHDRRIDVSYDSDSQTWDLGYEITPIKPVDGYAK